MAYKCVIIDDEQLARKLLKNYCDKTTSLDVVRSFKSALEALPFIKEHSIDLIFLDIQMPDISGLDFLKTLNNRSFQVILTTAHREYALDGFELNVIDYLLKPIAFPRFIKAIDKLTSSEKKQSKTIQEQYITLKSGKKVYKISPSNILYVKSEREYLKYATKINGDLLVYSSIKNALMDLQDDFVRVHRSYIVNLKAISFVEGNRININDTFIPISESYRQLFFEKWK